MQTSTQISEQEIATLLVQDFVIFQYLDFGEWGIKNTGKMAGERTERGEGAVILHGCLPSSFDK